jgi:signal transduction histidine kinase/DNA-binding response OmpR family regulator/ligand-binding sensor domain-containing protein
MLKKLLYILYLFLVLISVNAQIPDIHFSSYSVEQGFRYSNINDIITDKWGTIILTTDDGLIGFDGENFYPYLLPADTSIKQPITALDKLFKDSENNLWISSRKGVFFYDCNSFKVTQYTHRDNDPFSIANVMVTSILQDRKGEMWFGTWEGISKLDKKTGRFTNFIFENPIDSLYGHCVTAITEDKDGTLWLGTWRGILHFNPKNGKSKHYCQKEYYLLEQLNEWVKSIFFDRKGQLWAGAWGSGLQKYNSATDNFDVIRFPGDTTFNQINDICEDRNGMFWICVDAALICYNPTDGTYSMYRNDELDPQSFSPYPGTCLFEDNDKGMWIGTLSKTGLYYFNFRQKFSSIHILPNAVNPLNRNHRTTFFSGDKSGNIFIGSDISIYSWNPKSDSFSTFSIPYGFRFIDFLNRFWSVRNGTIYISAPNNPGSNIYSIKIENDVFINFDKTYKFRGDRNKNIWLLYKNNLFTIDSTARIHLSISGKSLNCDDHNPVESFILTRNNILIFQNKQQFPGIYDRSNGTLKMFHDIVPVIRTLYEDQHGTVWITTDKQVYYIKEHDYKLYKYRFNGFVQNYIYRLIEDRRGNMWLLHDDGLLRFKPGTDSFLIVNTKYGLEDRKSSNILFRSRTGMFYLGYRNEFVTFNPDSINSYPCKQHISITDIQSSGRSMFKKYFSNRPPESITNIYLNYNENVLTIYFKLRDYLNPDWIRYKYIMEGLDKNWTYSLSDFSHYNHLPSGEFVFKVYGCNSEGIWSSEYASLKIIINPPFWNTWWFRMILIFIFILILIAWQRIRERNLTAQKEKLEKEVKERTAKILIQKEEIEAQSELLRQNNEELELLNITKDKFFSIIAHDLKNPFYAISGLSDTLIRDLTKLKPDEAYEFLYLIKSSSDSASTLLDNLLQWARSQTNSITINPSSFNIRNLAENTIRLLKVIAASKNITLSNQIDAETVVFADENMITTVIRNIVNNAIKFTPQHGSVTLFSETAGQTVTIHIEDTGTGMDKEKTDNLFRIDQKFTSKGTEGEKGTGLGLIISKDFIDKNNGMIRVESEPGKGSRFSISLPAGSANSEKISMPQETVSDQEHVNLPKTLKEKPTLLVVEDNDELRMSLVKELEYFFTVGSAANGLEGYEKALELIPDLIVSDWMMPEMDGLEFCKKIKSDIRTNHIPYILLTAKSAVEEKIEGFDTGADEYLTKPFNSRLLLSRIYNLIDSRKKLRGRFMKQFLIDNTSLSDLKVNDREFIEKAAKVVEKHMENTNFDVPLFASELNFSRSQLHKKLIAITNQSATEFIRTIRLKEAARLLTEQDINVSEVFPKVGFNDRSYFTRSFTELFGMNPSDYKKK